MTIYVDPLFTAYPQGSQAKRHGNEWCHMITDGNLEELHKFAQSIGLKREWFQRNAVPHYDLTPSKRALAVRKGAVEKGSKELTPIRHAWMKQWNGGQPDWENNTQESTQCKQLTLIDP